MQTNCLLQQFVLAGQNPVSSYRLMPPLRFALLFFFFFIFPSNSSTAETNRDHPWKRRAPTTSLSINICLQTKRCQESFFFSLSEDLKPSSKVLGCFYHSAIQRVLDIFFFYVQQHLETLDRSVFSFSKDRKKKKGRFLKTDAHSVSRGIARLQQRKSRVKKQNKNKQKQIKRICFLDLQVFFFLYLSLQFKEGALHNQVRG